MSARAQLPSSGQKTSPLPRTSGCASQRQPGRKRSGLGGGPRATDEAVVELLCHDPWQPQIRSSTGTAHRSDERAADRASHDILRDPGQTYVSGHSAMACSEALLRQRGGGRIGGPVRRGAGQRASASMTKRVLAEISRLRKDGPEIGSTDQHAPKEGVPGGARETALRQERLLARSPAGDDHMFVRSARI